MSNTTKVLIVGAGLIAQEYVKVILRQNAIPIVVSRGKVKADKLRELYPKVEAITGGLDLFLEKNSCPEFAIIATSVDHLAIATKSLIIKGCKNILVEKPLTDSVDEAIEIEVLAEKSKSNIVIAFNRRAYQSVLKAKELIDLDGGVSSFHFDFTEAIFRINPEDYGIETVRHWGVANSSHVIDTAFYLGGMPKRLVCNHYGNEVSWHPSGSIFTGLGETIDDVPFTYHANWGAPGKWNIEIMTEKRKLLFSPMEKLRQQAVNTFAVEEVKLDYSLDTEFKSGFYHQVESFLKNEGIYKIKELKDELRIIHEIFDY